MFLLRFLKQHAAPENPVRHFSQLQKQRTR